MTCQEGLFAKPSGYQVRAVAALVLSSKPTRDTCKAVLTVFESLNSLKYRVVFCVTEKSCLSWKTKLDHEQGLENSLSSLGRYVRYMRIVLHTFPAFLAASRSCGTALTSYSGWGWICPSSTSWSYVVLMMPSKPSKDSGTMAPAAFNAAFLSCRDEQPPHLPDSIFACRSWWVCNECAPCTNLLPPHKEAQRHIPGNRVWGPNTTHACVTWMRETKNALDVKQQSRHTGLAELAHASHGNNIESWR